MIGVEALRQRNQSLGLLLRWIPTIAVSIIAVVIGRWVVYSVGRIIWLFIACGMILVVLRPRLGLYATLGILFFEDALIFDIAGRTTATTLVGAATFGAWIAHELVIKKKTVPSPHMRQSRQFLLMLAFVFLAFISGVWARDFGAWSVAVRSYSMYFALYMMAYHLLESKAQVDRLFKFLLLVAAASAIWGLWKYNFYLDDFSWGRANLGRMVGLIPLAIFYVKWGRKPVWMAVMLILILSIVASMARAGWLAILVVFSLEYWHGRRQTGVILGLTLVLFGFIVLYVSPTQMFVERLEGQIESLLPWSVANRLELWRRAGELITRNLLLGIGSGNFSTGFWRYYYLTEVGFPFFTDPGTKVGAHNVFVLVTAEQGLIGFLVFIGMLWQTLKLWKQSYIRFQENRDYRSADLVWAIGLGLLGMFTVALSHAMITEKLLWFMLALPLILHKQAFSPSSVADDE